MAEPNEPSTPAAPTWSGPFPKRKVLPAAYPSSPAHAPHGVRSAGIRAALSLTQNQEGEALEGRPVQVPTGTSPFLPPTKAAPEALQDSAPPAPAAPNDGTVEATRKNDTHNNSFGMLSSAAGVFQVNPLTGPPKARPPIQAWSD